MQTWNHKTDREYLCAGIVAATIANVNRDSKRHPKAFTPLDFTPIHRPKQTAEEEEAAMTAFFAGFGIAPLTENGGANHG